MMRKSGSMLLKRAGWYVSLARQNRRDFWLGERPNMGYPTL